MKLEFRNKQIAIAVASALSAAAMGAAYAQRAVPRQVAAPTSRVTSTTTRPAPTARSRCRSWSRSRPTSRHALGPRLVRPGRPRRQRQPQLHAGRRRDARDAGVSAGVRDGWHDHPGSEHELAEHESRRSTPKAACRAIRPTRSCGAGSRSRNISTRSPNTSPRSRTSRCSWASSRWSRATSTPRWPSSRASCRPSSTSRSLPTTAGYSPLGNATALASGRTASIAVTRTPAAATPSSAAQKATTGTAR